MTIVVLAGRSTLRPRCTDRRIAHGNPGTLTPATGGSLTALGDAGGFALSLLVGSVLLWLGYRVATTRVAVTPGSAPARRDR